jgi:hypothetical protein
VEYHEISLGDHALELHALARIVLRHLAEIGDEAVLAVAHLRIVLGVFLADELPYGFHRLRLIEHHVVEIDDGAFVFLRLIAHGLGLWLARTYPLASVAAIR